MPVLKDRKVTVQVHRTVQIEGEGKFEFYKFTLEDGGFLLSEEATDEEARAARAEMFGGLNKEAMLHEAVVKASHRVSDMSKLVDLMKSVLNTTQTQEKSDPSPVYYDEMSLRKDDPDV